MTRPASLLHPASYAHCWVCTWMGLLTCWRGFDQVGLEPSPVRTHWVTTPNFMSFRPLPRFRAYLGATSAGLGGGWLWCGAVDVAPTGPFSSRSRGTHAHQVVVAIARALVGFLGAIATQGPVTPSPY